jgi:hypothetical protein
MPKSMENVASVPRGKQLMPPVSRDSTIQPLCQVFITLAVTWLPMGQSCSFPQAQCNGCTAGCSSQCSCFVLVARQPFAA